LTGPWSGRSDHVNGPIRYQTTTDRHETLCEPSNRRSRRVPLKEYAFGSSGPRSGALTSPRVFVTPPSDVGPQRNFARWFRLMVRVVWGHRIMFSGSKRRTGTVGPVGPSGGVRARCIRIATELCMIVPGQGYSGLGSPLTFSPSWVDFAWLFPVMCAGSFGMLARCLGRVTRKRVGTTWDPCKAFGNLSSHCGHVTRQTGKG